MRSEADGAVRGDEAGAVLVLALLFIFVVSIVVGSIAGWATNDLNNTAKFNNARTVQYAVSSTVNTAIENIRYTPLFSTQLLTTAQAPGYCWTPSSGTTSLLPIDGVNVTVWCYTNYNAGSANTRVVTISACTTASEPAGQCATNPTLQAVVTFDDYPTGYSPPSTAQCILYCGTGMTEDSWTWSGSAVTPSTTTTTTVPPTTTTTTVPPTTTTTTVPPTTTTTTTTVPPTTTTTTTTTVPQSNGVTVTSSSVNTNTYSGDDQLNFSNTYPITALSITIRVAITTNLTAANYWNNSFPGNLTMSEATSGSYYTYTYVQTGSPTPAESGDSVVAQWNGSAVARVTSGDLWSVTSTSNGVNSTLSGHF